MATDPNLEALLEIRDLILNLKTLDWFELLYRPLWTDLLVNIIGALLGAFFAYRVGVWHTRIIQRSLLMDKLRPVLHEDFKKISENPNISEEYLEGTPTLNTSRHNRLFLPIVIYTLDRSLLNREQRKALSGVEQAIKYFNCHVKNAYNALSLEEKGEIKEKIKKSSNNESKSVKKIVCLIKNLENSYKKMIDII